MMGMSIGLQPRQGARIKRETEKERCAQEKKCEIEHDEPP